MADMFDISVKTLRLYDKMGLFKPENVDEKNSYRYYTADQINKLNTIISLKKVGFSLQEISKMFEDKLDYEDLARVLQLKRASTQKQVDTLLFSIEALDQMIATAEQSVGSKHEDMLTDEENAVVMSRVACLENIKFENILTQILWL
jgi:DNA-binding transcriptional MerR regulator